MEYHFQSVKKAKFYVQDKDTCVRLKNTNIRTHFFNKYLHLSVGEFATNVNLITTVWEETKFTIPLYARFHVNVFLFQVERDDISRNVAKSILI